MLPLAPKSNMAEEQATSEGKVEPIPDAAATKQAQSQPEEVVTKVYVRKFQEKTDSISQQDEVATYVCKCAPYHFFFINQQLMLIHVFLFVT